MIRFLACDLPVFLNIDLEVLQSFLLLSILLTVFGVVVSGKARSGLYYSRQATTFLPYFDASTLASRRVATASFALGP
jgi:hypothetical protein